MSNHRRRETFKQLSQNSNNYNRCASSGINTNEKSTNNDNDEINYNKLIMEFKLNVDNFVLTPLLILLRMHYKRKHFTDTINYDFYCISTVFCIEQLCIWRL